MIKSYPVREGDYDKLTQLMDLCKDVVCFKIESKIYFSSYIDAVKKYLYLNPSDKFIIWLDKNYKQLYAES